MELKNITLGALLIGFIGIIIGVTLIPEIAQQQGIMTTKSSVINESLDIGPAYNGSGGYDSSITFNVTNSNTGSGDEWKQTGCPIEDSLFGNATHVFTETTDYTFDGTYGTLTLVPTAVINSSGNDTVISYTHCRDGYLTDGSQRSITGLIILFSALALIGFLIYFILGKK